MVLRARVRCWRCWALFYKWHHLCHRGQVHSAFSSVHPGRGRTLWEPNGNLGIRNNGNEILPTSFKRQLTEREKCIFRSCLGGEGFFLEEGRRDWEKKLFSFGTAIPQRSLSQNTMKWGFALSCFRKMKSKLTKNELVNWTDPFLINGMMTKIKTLKIHILKLDFWPSIGLIMLFILRQKELIFR